jgi:RHS repeat-associated protein
MYIRILLPLVLAVLAAGLAPVAFAQQLLYIHADHLNAPRMVTNGSGTPVWRWDQTEPFGDNLPNEDPDGNGTPGHMPLRFPGQYFDKETNLHYNYFRDYDSTIGRYVQSDPIGLAGGFNTYLYALAKPLKYVDPDGTTVGSPAIPLPRQLPLTRPIPGPVDPVVPAPGNKKDDTVDHCTRLYVRCVQERWGGDWSCGDCHFYCTGINQAWPFEHCSPSLPETAGCRAAPKDT